MTTDRSLQRAALVAALVGFVASAVAGLLGQGWALVPLALGMALLTCYLMLQNRTTAAVARRQAQTLLLEVREAASRSADDVAALRARTEADASFLRADLQTMAHAAASDAESARSATPVADLRTVQGLRTAVDRGFQHLRSQVEQTPSATVEYALLRDLLADRALPMPQLGGWAVTAQTVIEITRRILDAGRPVTVLELGSGASTLWFSLAVERVGGRVVSLDHDASFAEVTRARLAAHGLSATGEVIHAPLVPIRVGDVEQSWYDLSVLPELPAVDLLFVDGPPADSGTHRRYPALPLLHDRLADGALVCLDDTIRDDEVQVLARWVAEYPGLTVEDRLNKSTLLRFRGHRETEEHA